MEALLPLIFSAAIAIGLGVLANLATPKVQSWLRERGWQSAPAIGLGVRDGGKLRVVPCSELPASVQRDKSVRGCLVVGSLESEPGHQQAPVQALKLGWRQLGGKDILNWLAWQARLVPQVVGREQELDALLAWAREGVSGPRARILSGPGGQGKTRLAAEVAEILQGEGWAAGFLSPRDLPAAYLLTERGALLLLDYPEEHRSLVNELLEELARLETEHRLRFLLLTRHGEDFWRREIDRANASHLFDEVALELGPIPRPAMYEVFRLAQEYTPRAAEQALPEPPTETAFQGWLDASAIHQRPLFVLAAAVDSVLHPEKPALGLSGADVVLSLVRREMRRLRNEGEAAGLEREALPRLTALAAVAGGLDRHRLRQLAEESDRLELNLPASGEIFDRVKATGRVRDGKLPAPAPDLFAAALLVEVLKDDADMAPEWLWWVLQADVSRGLSQLGRLAYDAEVTLGLEARPSEWLRACFAGRPERCRLASASFYDSRLPPGLLPSAKIVWEAALKEEVDEGKRAKLLNILSVHLADAGDSDSALEAIQQAVDIRRRLAEANPARVEPELAGSLNNLSSRLSDAGDGEAALKALQQATVIYRRLAEANPARFEPELAMSLNNLSNRLSDAGDREGALRALQQATVIYRRLVESNPAHFEPELAMSLNNLAICLGNTGDSDGALQASQQAVDIRRRLAEANPARFEPDLALSLNNLAIFLSDAGDGEGALEAIQQAVELVRPFAEKYPESRFGSWHRGMLANLMRLERGSRSGRGSST